MKFTKEFSIFLLDVEKDKREYGTNSFECVTDSSLVKAVCCDFDKQ